MEDVTNPVSLTLFTVCRIFLSSLTLYNTSSFLTRSVQMILSPFLQHYISKPQAILTEINHYIYFNSRSRKICVSQKDSLFGNNIPGSAEVT